LLNLHQYVLEMNEAVALSPKAGNFFILARLGEPTAPPALAPRARDCAPDPILDE
jgi:hypothetical protein